jgi:copper chaperone CopZ
MKPLLTALTLAIIAHAAVAADKPQTITRTFYVSGIACGSCVYMVQQSIAETKGVKDVTVVQVIDNYANVTFDPKVVSDHQIAQAVREAYPLHGMPYLATLKLRIPEYAKNATKVDAVLARWKNAIKAEVADKAKGEILIHFEPLQVDESKTQPQGWNLAQFTEALQSPAPKGLGLSFTLEEEAR